MISVLRQDREIWDLYTRKEEYEASPRDRHGRFPYYRSRHRDIRQPRASQLLIEKGYQCEYPESQPFAICCTHDIDKVYEPLTSKGLEIVLALKNGDRRRAVRTIPLLRSKRLPLWNFKEIADVEEAYGARSSLFFLAIGADEPGHAYAIEDMEQEIGALRDRGWEIGLHGGCHAFQDFEKLQDEKRRLERVLGRRVTGYRNHFLKFKVPLTWDLLEKAGFLYDTTLGYPDCIGFRNGMCHPFRPFDLNAGKELDILEIPLAVMDQTLLESMQLGTTQAWDQIEDLMNTVERQHGVLTILWHNTYMIGEPLRFYRKILEYGHKRGAWMTSCAEIAAWWKKNGLHRSTTP